MATYVHITTKLSEGGMAGSVLLLSHCAYPVLRLRARENLKQWGTGRGPFLIDQQEGNELMDMQRKSCIQGRYSKVV